MNSDNDRLREQAEAQQDHERPQEAGGDDDGPVSGGGEHGQKLGHGQDPGWRSQAPEGTSAQAPAEGERGQGQGQGQVQQHQQRQGGIGDVGVSFDADPELERAVSLGSSSGHDGHVHMQVREHMEVVGADGVHLGTVDAVDGERIKLTKADSGAGAVGQQGRHHYLPVGLVAAIEGNRVRLSANADVAYGMEDQGD